MSPNLEEGNVIIVNKLIYRLKDISRNDVIVLSQDEKYMIKRVVGLPGEFVEYKDNYVFINGVKYKETFIDEKIKTEDFSIKDIGYDVIPKDMYLVLGDNRENSLDSRSYGLISKKQVIGQAWIRIWPLNNIEIIK